MKNSTSQIIAFLFIVLGLAACTPAATPQGDDIDKEEKAPTFTITPTETPLPTETVTSTTTAIPPTPTFPAPEGADLPDSAVRSMNEQGQEVILDQPGGDALWTLIEDENGELAWQQPTASPEMIAAIADQIKASMESTQSNQIYLETLPKLEAYEDGVATVVAYALNVRRLTNLHFDPENGAIVGTNPAGEQEWFFTKLGAIGNPEKPESFYESDLERGWVVRENMLQSDEVDFSIEIFVSADGVDYDGDKVWFEWDYDNLSPEVKGYILRYFKDNYGHLPDFENRCQWVIVEDTEFLDNGTKTADGAYIRSKRWSEDGIFVGHDGTPTYASQRLSAPDGIMRLAMMFNYRYDHEADQDINDKSYGFNLLLRFVYSFDEYFHGEKGPGEAAKLFAKREKFFADIDELIPGKRNFWAIEVKRQR